MKIEQGVGLKEFNSGRRAQRWKGEGRGLVPRPDNAYVLDKRKCNLGGQLLMSRWRHAFDVIWTPPHVTPGHSVSYNSDMRWTDRLSICLSARPSVCLEVVRLSLCLYVCLSNFSICYPKIPKSLKYIKPKITYRMCFIFQLLNEDCYN